MKRGLIHLFLVLCISASAIEANAQIGHWHWQQPAVIACRSNTQPRVKQTHLDGELTRGNQGYGYAPPTIYKESDQQLYVFQAVAEYLRDEIGRGPNGLIRLQNPDWSDSFLHKYSPNIYHWRTESHLATVLLLQK